MEFGTWSDGRRYVDIKDYRFRINNGRIFEGINYELEPQVVAIYDKKTPKYRKIHPINVTDYESDPERYLFVEK